MRALLITCFALMMGLFGGQLYGQIELGVQTGVLQPVYRYSCGKHASPGCEGSAQGQVGWTAGLVAVMVTGDTTFSLPVTLELGYTHRAVHIQQNGYSKVGGSDSEEDLRYGMVQVGVLPHFAWRGNDPWYGAAGLRFGFPVRAERQVQSRSFSAYPVAQQADTAYFQTNAVNTLKGIDPRIVLQLGYRPTIGNAQRIALEATVDHGLSGLIRNSVDATINSTDLGLRVSYFFISGPRPASN